MAWTVSTSAPEGLNWWYTYTRSWWLYRVARKSSRGVPYCSKRGWTRTAFSDHSVGRWQPLRIDSSVNAGRVSQLNQFCAFPLLLCQSNVSWRWDSMDWSEKWPHVQATNKDHHETSIWLFQNLHYQRWYGWEPLRICKYSQIPLVRISEFYNFHFSRSIEIHTNGIWLYIAQQNVCIIWTSKQMYCKLLIQVLVIIISFSGN